MQQHTACGGGGVGVFVGGGLRVKTDTALRGEIGRNLAVLTMMLLFKIAVNRRAQGKQSECDS